MLLLLLLLLCCCCALQKISLKMTSKRYIRSKIYFLTVQLHHAKISAKSNKTRTRSFRSYKRALKLICFSLSSVCGTGSPSSHCFVFVFFSNIKLFRDRYMKILGLKLFSLTRGCFPFTWVPYPIVLCIINLCLIVFFLTKPKNKKNKKLFKDLAIM